MTIDGEDSRNLCGDSGQRKIHVLNRLTTEKIRHGRSTLIVFHAGATDQKALVVELMNEGGSTQGTRKQCGKEGVPYLRFYYDHDGWWNTKPYVIRRTREALR